ncbi:LysR family transcriptional regulator [Spiribacter halobius]|uniref:LysR family transcriptional regulator n=2 Tax=Sediminicurvatus halobius TaxID=2182432 RepID=A0A2U2N9D7_9GAMM|nr:LysR family transcriptional regulator [Spiribacter halobius]PWG65791.1 LysR family transcriptional regulator [Spiribacter halobius]UEX77833.1 LysR family transcriptional regulator [Spiribacter halobius]
MPNEDTLHGLNWNDIKFFLALVRQKRLTRVARTLGTTHVTVANRLSALEKALSVQLLAQSSEGYRLTKAGEQFFRHAEALERQLILGLERTEPGGSVQPKVRVGVTEGLGDNYLSPRIAAWLRGQAIDVDFISLPKSTSVTSREADISITLEKPRGEYVIRRLLTQYVLGVYASPEYVAAHGPMSSREALLGHPWIGYIESMLFAEELKYHYELATNLNFVFQSTSIRAQQQAARQGLGLSILPNYMALEDPQLQRVLPELCFVRQYWISTNRDLHRFEAVNLVWNFILECCRRDQALLFQVGGDSGSEATG